LADHLRSHLDPQPPPQIFRLPSKVLVLQHHQHWPQACRSLGCRGYAIHAARILETDHFPDKVYVQWRNDQVSLCSTEGLASQAELLSKLDARSFVRDTKKPMMILAPSQSSLANLEGENSQRELQRRVARSKIVVINGERHEIYIDCPVDCQKSYLNFLANLHE
jgi:hypothetical protein